MYNNTSLSSKPCIPYLYLMSEANFSLSPSAVSRLGEIMALPESAQTPYLRVAVLAGGCNGFQYKFDLTAAREEDDALLESGPARVLLDPASLEMLAGAELDYVDSLMGAYFTVRNPQAKSSCGCGTSFAVD